MRWVRPRALVALAQRRQAPVGTTREMTTGRGSREDYITRIEQSCLCPAADKIMDDPCVTQSAPLLFGTDPWASHVSTRHVPDDLVRCNTAGVDSDSQEGPTPDCGWLEVVYPFSTDLPLRNAWSGFGGAGWAPLRLGKFYEALDAITADVAYRHVKLGGADVNKLSLVTAAHLDSMKLRPSSLHKDMKMRSYVISTGRSSIEVRTDIFQASDGDGSDQLITFTHTVMVALDSESLQAGGKPRSIPVPALVVHEDDAGGQERLALAAHHQTHRKNRQALTMSLHDNASNPPTPGEMEGVHALFREAVAQREIGVADRNRRFMTDTEITSSVLVYSEQRNMHGKLFGGFIARHAYETGFIAAYNFTGRPPVPLGFDQIIFSNAVAVGDLVRFTAKVVHSQGRVFRVWVTVDVIDPQDEEHRSRTNKLQFTFLQTGPEDSLRTVLPETYPEILMHLDASRWYKWQGANEARFKDILDGEGDAGKGDSSN